MLVNSNMYGNIDLMNKWYDVEKYFKQHNWDKDKILTKLRPSLETLKDKKQLIGVEVGIGNCYNTINIFNNLDIKKMYLLDVNYPKSEMTKNFLNDNKDKITFLQGNSLNTLNQINEELDFVYLDGDHTYEHVLQEIKIVYPKIKENGLLAGHDYEQFGVMSAVNTFLLNIWRHIKKKPDSFYYEACEDEHPGYSQEQIDIGFPIDWWHVKKHKIDNLVLDHLYYG